MSMFTFALFRLAFSINESWCCINIWTSSKCYSTANISQLSELSVSRQKNGTKQ